MTRRLTVAERHASAERDLLLGEIADQSSWDKFLVEQAVLAVGRGQSEFSANDFRTLLPELGLGFLGAAISALHGGGRCYRQGCRRDECRTAYRTERKIADYRAACGIKNPDCGHVAAHLRRLLASGRTRLDIAAEAHVSERAIRLYLDGLHQPRPSSARALLAVQPLSQTPRVPTIATARRIQAMACQGWAIKHTAPAVGCSWSYFFEILRGDYTSMPREIAEAVERLARKLNGTRGPSSQSRAAARRNGWVPLAAWDDIDDPDEQPNVGSDEELGRNELAAYRRQEIAHLASFGIPDQDIAARLGISDSTVQQQIRDMRKAA
ncbi:hypothetical protein GT352_27990 [Streptomyces sp. SID1046]|uniref:hypothetical protein n=1 Tax=Streptomyces sp. SID1046 TaxID=2690249 RepID=UPI00136D53E2|nr:hypothetical protein [Streptomyces sp. SID1046]MYV77742.1 hypothetical protein [Streptomyces sp. SID1046]